MRAATVAAVAVAAVLLGCGAHGARAGGGDAGQGRERIVYYGCGSCHTIGGIETANGTVGPRLTHFRSDRYIAGDLPNTPANAASWIEDPKRYEPHTIMPDLGVSSEDARAIVAYLLEH
jgi:cytochrome c